MKIRTDFITNSSSSSFVTIHFSSGIIEDYLNENQVIYDQESYDNLEELLNEVMNVVSGDWLNGYAFPKKVKPVKALCEWLIAINPEFDDMETDETMTDFVEFLHMNESEIEKEATGDIFMVTNNDGDYPFIDGIRFDHGRVQRLEKEYDEEDDVSETLSQAFDSADIPKDMIDVLFDTFGITDVE